MSQRTAGFAALLVMSVGLAACDTTVISHGHQLNADDVARIQPGLTTQGEVTALLGSPSSVLPFESGSWVYINRRIEGTNYFNMDLSAQDVVRISFDEQGIVNNIETLDMTDGREIDPNEDVTPTSGNEINAIEQFLGNIGRFNNDAALPPQ